MLLIAATKLHPLWHSPFLPLFFLINCIYIGYSIAILESVISSYAFRRPYETRQLSGLAGIIPWLATLWLVVIVVDLARRGQLGAVGRFDIYSCFFLLEFALLVFGSLILFSKHNRRSPRWLFVSAALIVLGGALYRFNVYLIGFNPGKGWIYFPSLAEVMISVGIVAIELLGYQVLVKMVPVLPRIHLHQHSRPRRNITFHGPGRPVAHSPTLP
jgi:Ni/Fe-hydrogenase subunit HybB-like protein